MTEPPLLAVPLTAELVRGAVELEQTDDGLVAHRLPRWAREQYSDPQLAMVDTQPSGVRLVLRTAATVLELETRRTVVVLRGIPPRPDGCYDLVVDGAPTARSSVDGGTVITRDLATGATEVVRGEPGTVRFAGLPPHPKTVEIWLPHQETTALVALRADAPVQTLPPAPDARTWLHHGSSISQGSNAAGPLDIWPVRAARAAGVELVNLGFGGSALLDPFVARTIRDTPADLISVKLGINVVNADLMRRRAFVPAVHGFLDTVRDGHPDTPLLLVSPLLCPIHEDTPGPGAFDVAALQEGRVAFVATGDPAAVAAGALTLTVIREELAALAALRRRTDPLLHHLDGLELYGPADVVEHPLPDRLHPDTATHALIAQRFSAAVFSGDGPFAAGAVDRS